MLRDVGKQLDGEAGELIDNFVGLLSAVDDAIGKGDLNEAKNLLQQAQNIMRQMLPFAKSEGLRQAISNTIESNAALVQKLSAGTASLKDLFFTNAATSSTGALAAIIDDDVILTQK